MPTNDSTVPLSSFAKDNIIYRSQIVKDKEPFSGYVSDSSAPKTLLRPSFEKEIKHLRPILKQINKKLVGLAKTSNSPFIFRINPMLRRENERAYEPEMLSIGPYHRGKKNLQVMEMYKLKYLDKLLKRPGESGAKTYITALMEAEEAARNCYAEHIDLSQADFVEMMLLDGCFIIGLLQARFMDDPIFEMRWFRLIMFRDLLVFDNQLPFFILKKLFEITNPDQEADRIIGLAISYLYPCIANETPAESSCRIGRDEILHLLDLIYRSYCSTGKGEDLSSSPDQKRSDFSVINCFQLCKGVPSKREQKKEDRKSFKLIKSVVELKEHGVEFRKKEKGKSWLHIRFKNGVLEIPRLMIEDKTDSFFRNLIAYEQYMVDLGYSESLVTDYTKFMDCLINSSKDVEILRHRGIIDNLMGSDEVVAEMFNKISNQVNYCPETFSYTEIFEEVNDYCSKRRNTWRAHFMRNYFSNPCSSISFLAATLLLVLTILQTIFSILQYCEGNC